MKKTSPEYTTICHTACRGGRQQRIGVHFKTDARRRRPCEFERVQIQPAHRALHALGKTNLLRK